MIAVLVKCVWHSILHEYPHNPVLINWFINWYFKIDQEPKKIHRWEVSIWKDVQHCMSLGNYKLKQWDPSTLLEWPISKILKTPNAAEDMERQELLFSACGNKKMVQPLWKTV